jgi:hypothetical protein
MLDCAIATRILTAGALRVDRPGIDLTIEGFYRD